MPKHCCQIEIGWAADRVKAFSTGRDGSESILRIVIATESGDACGHVPSRTASPVASLQISQPSSSNIRA